MIRPRSWTLRRRTPHAVNTPGCITAGGFPLALHRSEAARDRWFDDYSALCLERDLLEAGRVRRPAAFVVLMSRLAAQTAQLLNMSSAARAAGLPVSTAADYTRLLESSFLVFMLPAWGRTLLASTAARPKVHVSDSGLAARLLRLSSAKLAGLDPAALQQFGHLLETFVVGEILKQASWMQHRPHIGHWRSHDGHEVDVVVESGRDGSVAGIEVKAGSRVRARDRRGLRKLRDTLGERFALGVVLHTGPHSVRYRQADDDRIIALPVDRLWS